MNIAEKGSRSVLTVLALSLMAPARAAGGDGIDLTWRGKQLAAQELTGPAAAAADVVYAWEPFLAGCGYRAVLSDDAQLLLLLSHTYDRASPRNEHREVEVMSELMAQTAEVLGRVMPPPTEAAPPAVLVCVRARDYAALLQHIGALEPLIAGWTQGAAGHVCGFVLSQPLVGCWIEDPPGVEEWEPYNELVHRAGQLLVRRQFPRLPTWLQLGLAWHLEDSVRGGIYCFPGRDGFVSAYSHTDWGVWLRNEFKRSRRHADGKPPQIAIEEFAGWDVRRDGYDDDAAHLAFGVVRYLVHEHPDDVAALLRQLAEATVTGSKRDISETEWRIDPDFVLPAEAQREALEQIEPAFSAKVTKFFLAKKANDRTPPKVGKRHR